MILEQKEIIGFSSLQRSLLAGAIGSILLVGAQTLLTLPRPSIAYATMLGILTFAGVSLLLPRKKHLAERLLEIDGFGRGEADRLARFVEECRECTGRLEALHDEQQGPIYDIVSEIIELSHTIIQGIIDDPRDLARSRMFRVYLKAAVEIVEKMTDLEKKGANQDTVQDIRQRSETVLQQICRAFEKQYEKNLENDILSVDVDLDVLARALKQEGL